MNKFNLAIWKIIVVFLMLIVTGPFSSATHNRAGEITMRQISDLTFEITITTYTYTLSAADRSQLDVVWGDNSTSVAPRVDILQLPNFYRRNIYKAQHTYPGPGTYQIVVQDPNRNFGVKNIPNSVNVYFSIKTIITINPRIGVNSTPVLLNPPYDKAALGQLFIHNPAAFDPDGDSISYSLSVCTEYNGQPIKDYSLPAASDSLYVNSINGDLVWNTPVDTGIYNIAMNIEEWRSGVKIGNIVRDMQIEVYSTTNNPPLNDSLPSLCVEAGQKIEYLITGTDPDNDGMKHFITGGPYAVNNSPARDSLILSEPGTIASKFIWQTVCEHVRYQPYQVVVKTEDVHPEFVLFDIDNMQINVIGPAPENPDLLPSSSSIRVSWDQTRCNNATGYNIYRREGESGYIVDSCTYGLPAYTGFIKVGTTKPVSETVFNDNNQGTGLLQGIRYCYRVTAIYPDGSESYPSDEVCSTLSPGAPFLLNTSVTDHDPSDGSVFVSWIKPKDLDTIPANGPYEYIIYRSDNLWGQNLSQTGSFQTDDLNDTTYLDTGINTLIYPYSYSVELYNNEPLNRFLIGRPEIASTLFPLITEQDNQLHLEFINNVPWLNYDYVIYRSNSLFGVYDSLDTTTQYEYTDMNLSNGVEYCYYIKSRGSRVEGNTAYYTENISHRVCATPRDTFPPCPPQLSVSSICDSMFNRLIWTNPNNYCADDVIKYYIYFWPQLDMLPSLIDSTLNPEDTVYLHFLNESLAGCYYVTAIDSFHNESIPSPVICVDECFSYKIPNVFSPNGDGINDILRPIESQEVEKIDMKIYNRWGQLVFETSDPLINWDGKHKDTDDLVSQGVYYYICDVYEKRLTGIEPRNITGFVYVYSEKGAIINPD